MYKLPHNWHREIGEIHMTDTEKADMRRRLNAYMRAHPLRGMWSPFEWHVAPQLTAAALVILLCTGTAYAAQSALPGDILYPVKIHVNEGIAQTLAISSVSKAELNARLAIERLHEAQSLALVKRLDATTTDELQINFDEHARVARDIAISVDKIDPDEGASIRAHLQTLNAEGQVLREVGRQSDDSDTSEHSGRLADHVSRIAFGESDSPAIIAATSIAANTITALQVTTPTPIATIVQNSDGRGSAGRHERRDSSRIKKQALQTLEQLQKQFSALRHSLGATTSAALNAQISQVQATVLDGETSSSSDVASEHFENALSSGTALKTFIEADSRLHEDILSPLLKDTEDTNDHRHGGNGESRKSGKNEHGGDSNSVTHGDDAGGR